MSTGNGNGKWQLAFWVITVICGVWLVAITSNVIANDRLRATEDEKIKDKVMIISENINEKLTSISGDIREIKAKLSVKSF